MKDKTFNKLLISLVVPVALQNLLSAVVSASDALMLGALNQSSLSAISLATQIQFVLGLFVGTITIGVTILAAQYWGKDDKNTVEDVLGIGLFYGIIISIIFMLAAILTPNALMRVYTNETVLVALGAKYLRVVAPSYVFYAISQVYLTIMKNSGRTTRSTLYSSAAVVLNFILNYLLIFGIGVFPRMEIEGAALATVISRMVELILVSFESIEAKEIKIRIVKVLKINRMLNKDFWTYTLPVLANMIAWGCGFSAFSAIMGHLGNDAVAANSIAGIVKNIMVCVATGISVGSGIIVGNELGRNDLERARQYGDKICHITLAVGAITGGIIAASSPMLVKIIPNLTETSAGYLSVMLLVCGYYMIGKSINMTVVSGIFTAGGDTKFGFICDVITLWGVCIPLGILAAFVFKLPVVAVYVILNLDEIVKLPAVYKHYKKYKWLNNLTGGN